MPTLAAKIAVAAAATVLTWAGIEAVRLRHVAAAPPPRPRAEADVPRTNEVPRLVPVTVEASAPKEPPAEAPPPLGIAAMARIHGRVLGGERGESPPEVSAEDSSRDYDAEVEADGQFTINLPAGSYTLVATMNDLVATANVAGLAQDEDREVTLVLDRGASIQGRVHNSAGTFRGESCESSQIPCQIADLEVGNRVDVRANASGSRCETGAIDLVPGMNMIVLACEADRIIQGVFRSTPNGEDPEATASVRCSASEESQRAHGRLFQIKCLERLPTVEYQRTPSGPWMTAPIQSSGPGSTGFVEIL